MPELPEVEVVRLGLEPLLSGQMIVEVKCFREGLRYPFPDFSSLTAQHFTSVQRRAKYLLFRLDGPEVLIWHLGMTGQFHVVPVSQEKTKHEHARFVLSNGNAMIYRDPRRFGYVGLLPADTWASHVWFSNLGVEPLQDAFTGEYLFQLTRQRKAPIKQVLMDASVVVGIGNIYASESLFRARIHPATAACRISGARIQRLVTSVRTVLGEALEAGGSTISDFVHVDGKPGYFAHDFRVYGRDGKACRLCSTPIRKLVQAGRSTFYCPSCQH
ncbi:MAG: bifunctional DNA-formamidopyrimidine glycosylase/DNA-(apurinic or apyrimidinic site) lyase [Zetaproteobacteria bacterium CG_4_9_14_3_um_filter_49_83]|nr:MAG: DNA-formamidopyrimidine glycosylase [Zetaproteobacteria bacterium CG17_big_fil_post_rev_8_21_14_2_50_50_13]PIY56972.1 MAG: bifunctional DNA-formamidopyrimidine glycosylase/DNA-(apurinic or apyrimidinic site) lyase [Zetaproteobacteria bacterium CG_4_10_14_0_8_um_filter_49_80]PJA34639.1 MAG: bifunctional DNA-formamidopyrimidine glycosylase/DNA-(apurinic or apyrimidinic site) lyase [Zetaproteobacteria bacterium CG_4_9_14_3_um_filter_49_83]